MGRSTKIRLPSTGKDRFMYHHITLLQCAFPDCFAQSCPCTCPLPQAPLLYALAKGPGQNPPFPCALPYPHWLLLVSVPPCTESFSNVFPTPQLASDKRESLVSLTVHLSPFLPTALWTSFSCPFHLCLALETECLTSSFWLTSNP